jgi:hypothetical protein
MRVIRNDRPSWRGSLLSRCRRSRANLDSDLRASHRTCANRRADPEARKNGPRVRLCSRPGNNLSCPFPQVVESLAGLPSRSCIIDGEAVCCDDGGRQAQTYRAHNEDQSSNAKSKLRGGDLNRRSKPSGGNSGRSSKPKEASARSWVGAHLSERAASAPHSGRSVRAARE